MQPLAKHDTQQSGLDELHDDFSDDLSDEVPDELFDVVIVGGGMNELEVLLEFRLSINANCVCNLQQ